MKNEDFRDNFVFFGKLFRPYLQNNLSYRPEFFCTTSRIIGTGGGGEFSLGNGTYIIYPTLKLLSCNITQKLRGIAQSQKS